MPPALFLRLYSLSSGAIMATMPKRRAPYSAQTAIDFDAPGPEPVETVANDVVAERSGPEYTTKPGWIDIAGKTRTWLLLDPRGTQLAAITTKRDARKLADLLNRVRDGQRGAERSV